MKSPLPPYHHQKQLGGFLSPASRQSLRRSATTLSIGLASIGTTIGLSEELLACNNSSTCTTNTTTTTSTFGQLTGNATAVNKTYPGGAAAGCTATNSQLYGTLYSSPGVAPYNVTVNGHANGNATIQGGGINGGSMTTVSRYVSHCNHSNSGSGSGSGSGGGWC